MRTVKYRYYQRILAVKILNVKKLTVLCEAL